MQEFFNTGLYKIFEPKYKDIIGKPFITVSAKGISNGLSNIPNDGADFGPDTTLNATSPSQIGSPYSQTSGIQEALNYASQLYQKGTGTTFYNTDILIDGWLNVYTDIIAPTNINHIRIFGTGRATSVINFISGSRGFVLDNTNVYFFNHIGFQSYSPTTLPNPPSYLVSYSVSTLNPNQAMWFRDCSFYQNTNKTQIFNIQNATTVLISDVDFDANIGFLYMSGTTPNQGSYLGIIGSIANGEGMVIDGFDVVDLTNFYGPFLGFLGNNNSVNIKNGYYLNYINFLRAFPNGTYSAATIGKISIKDVEIANTLNARNNPTLFGTNGSQLQSTVSIFEIDGLTYIDTTGTTASTGTVYPIGFSNYPPNSGVYGTLVTKKVSYKNILALDGLPIFEFEQLPPTLTANPPVSGTVYQNPNPFDIRLKIPVTYNPTSTAAATLATGISPSSTVTTSTKVSIPAGLTAADGQILTYEMVIPANWYYELIATNATIGTVEAQTT